MESLEALKAELAAERDALAAAKDAREAARQADVLRAELENVKRQRREEEALAKAEAKFGLIGKKFDRVDTMDGMILVRCADGLKVRRWQDEHGENATTESLRELARPCVEYPELGDFDAMVAERPVIMVAVATAVLKLAGLRLKQTSGK